MKRKLFALLLVLCLLLCGCADSQPLSLSDTSKGTTVGDTNVPETSTETDAPTTPGTEGSTSDTTEGIGTDTSAADTTQGPIDTSDDSSTSGDEQTTDKPVSEETKPPATTDEPETSKETGTTPPQTEKPDETEPPPETASEPETTVPPDTSKEPETTTPPDTTVPPNTTAPPTESTNPPETDPPVTTSPYDYPFDPDAIRSECISIASGYGLVLDETLTPDNSSWANPDQATPNTQGTRLKRMLAETIEYYSKDYREANGLYPYEIRCYNIYIEDMGDGTFRIYFLFMM